MGYHQREVAVNRKVECTLENALGLSDRDQELIRFGSGPFNAARTDNWPADIAARRRTAANNLKNAKALNSEAAKARAARLSLQLAKIERDARELHQVGSALRQRLANVARTLDTAWNAILVTVREAERLTAEELPLERHHRLALAWLRRHKSAARDQLALRLWQGSSRNQDPEDIWIGGAFWAGRYRHPAGSVWSVHADLSEHTLWETDALWRAKRVLKSIAFAKNKAGGRVNHLHHEFRIVKFRGLARVRVAPLWQTKERAYNSADLKAGSTATSDLRKAWQTFEDHNKGWDADLKSGALVPWQHEDASKYWQKASEPETQQAA